jgi:predicted Fe-Mo cluster-binding NifX family protein
MKLFITSNGNSISQTIDSSFSRCSFFLIYETEDDSYEFKENPFQNAQTSVGVSVAQFAIDNGVNAVIAANPGPREFNLLKEAKIPVYHSPANTKLRAVITAFEKGELIHLEEYLPYQSK